MSQEITRVRFSVIKNGALVKDRLNKQRLTWNSMPDHEKAYVSNIIELSWDAWNYLYEVIYKNFGDSEISRAITRETFRIGKNRFPYQLFNELDSLFKECLKIGNEILNPDLRVGESVKKLREKLVGFAGQGFNKELDYSDFRYLSRTAKRLETLSVRASFINLIHSLEPPVALGHTLSNLITIAVAEYHSSAGMTLSKTLTGIVNDYNQHKFLRAN